MRLVTWNCCRGPYEKNSALLSALEPDIAVIQECARPTTESDTCLWFGDNPRQGVAVLASPPYRLQQLPALPDVPKYVVPISVTGPIAFTMFAVWSKKNTQYPYIEAVTHAVDMYRQVFEAGPVVLIGDLNSNAIWDATHPRDLNHTALVARLKSHDLVSAYHAHHNEAHGRETRPTYYFQWNELRPYHIDYCFVPEQWMGKVQRVEIGAYADWKQHSDHRPLVVEIADPE
jgi:endonuclease/exonuclease/phosphatase family metal-dependent hydrolase